MSSESEDGRKTVSLSNNSSEKLQLEDEDHLTLESPKVWLHGIPKLTRRSISADSLSDPFKEDIPEEVPAEEVDDDFETIPLSLEAAVPVTDGDASIARRPLLLRGRFIRL